MARHKSSNRLANLLALAHCIDTKPRSATTAPRDVHLGLAARVPIPDNKASAAAGPRMATIDQTRGSG